LQLFHIKSQKYVTVVPGKLADGERENLRITLDPQGSTFSWIEVAPRFKIDKDGDPVMTNTEMYLKFVERPSEYIHVAELNPIGDRLREVNCSLESSAWKMTIFQSSLDYRLASDPTKKIILTSQMVYINDPETRCNLTIASDGVAALEEPGEDEEKQFNHEFGDIVLEPSTDQPVSSRLLWFLESRLPMKGGIVRWKAEGIRLKHVNTGLYLRILTDKEVSGDGKVYSYALSTTADGTDPNATFSVEDLVSANKILSFEKPVRIGKDGIYLERGEVLDNMKYVIAGCTATDRAVTFKIYKYLGEFGTGEESLSPNKEPFEIFSGLSVRKYLSKYNKMLQLPASIYVSTIWPTADRADLEMFSKLMERAVFFSQGFPISATDIVLGVDRAPIPIRLRRQKLFCDQGTLEILIRMIHSLQFLSDRADDGPKLTKTKAKTTDEEQMMLRMGRGILEKCFNLLFWCISDNPANQMYVADHMPVLLSHLGGQPLAGKCVTEMLASNMELQETKIGTREIAIFVDKLRFSKMNSMYLQLLKACCSCQGNGIDANQCKVTEFLFSNTADVIIQLHCDAARCTPEEWRLDDLYLPSSPLPGSPVLSDHLITTGLPTLSLAWTTNSIDFSPLGLFGKLSVSVEELYRPNSALLGGGSMAVGKKATNVRKNVSIEQKISVSKYFINQMFLCAEMCMDRNYVAMHTVDDMFPYEVLITMLRLTVVDSLKSAAARLLLCLHVDRDPQAETKIPCFTRTWSEVTKSADSEPRLPFVEPGRRYIYGLLQQTISDHVKVMSGARWTEYSMHVLQLLKRMVGFNFYGTNERMNDVVGPLIKALDRRQVVAPDASVIVIKQENSIENMTASADKLATATEIKDLNDIEQTVPDGQQDHSLGVMFDPFAKHRKLLDALESMPFLMFIMALVIASVVIAIYETVANVPAGPGSPLFTFAAIVTGIFAIELSARAYCYVLVRDTLWSFSKNFFNQIDLLVIIIDIVFYSLPPEISSQGRYAKALRLVRLARLLRLIRAARVYGKAAAARRKKGSNLNDYVVPSRYSRCPQHEIDTMVQGVEILQLCQSVIEDRNLTLLLKYFYLWECEKDARSPGEIFEQVLQDSQELTLGINDFDGVFLDLLMFTSGPLVQSSLEILMAHHSSRKSLLENAAQIQLLVSGKRERQYKIVDQMLQQLERNAETHELWGELETESDRAISKQTLDIMIELRDICRVRRKIFEFDQEYEPDAEVQILFRNLGCFGICMKVLGLLDFCEEHTDEETGVMDEIGANTQQLCRQVNSLLYWFFFNCADNQELGFTEIEFFLNSLDDDIGSHNCVRAIFYRNERLMRLVSHGYIQDMTELICKAEADDRSPHHLALMMAITHVDDHGMRDNQLEIMKQLTSPGRAEKIACFFTPILHVDYAKKVELMAEFMQHKDVSIDELPPLLAYHLNLLELFSTCTVSKIGGVTSIEAKAQAIFGYENAINALLDDRTILIAKIRLAQFILNAVIEVEMMIAGLEYTAIIWKLLYSFAESLTNAAEDIRKAQELGWAHPAVSRQAIEYHLVCIQIVGGFFTKYFDYGSFRIDDKSHSHAGHGHHSAGGSSDGNANKNVKITTAELKSFLALIHGKVAEVEALESPILSPQHRRIIAESVVAIQKNMAKDAKIEIAHKRHSVSRLPSDNAANEDDEINMSNEERLIKKYSSFIKALQSDESVQAGIYRQNANFIEVLEAIPFLTDDTNSDIRQETLFRKLVQHIRENISIVNNERRLNAQCTKTTIWLMKAFRTMLENRMGMTIDQRDEDGGAEEDARVAPVIAALSSCGVVTLCIDLIAVGIDPVLQMEAIKLGVGLLFKEGGALEVQTLMNHHLSTTNSEFFFKQLHLSIQKLIEWHRLKDVVVLEDGAEPELPEEILIIRFMQLMSEGHYLPNQDIMREQPNNNTSHNILDDLVPYLACLSRLHCRTSTAASIRVGATILEVIQGPCKDNQFHFAMKTELLETLNRIMRSKPLLDCVYDEEIELKLIAVDIFQGLLEGQALRSTVYERLLSVIHLDIILQLSGSLKDDPDAEDANIVDQPEVVRVLTEDEEVLKTQSLVLLQMLCDCKPSIRDEFGLSKNIEDFLQSGTSVIEVVWNGDLQRRFFNVPKICEDVAKSSMDYIVENVDRSNLENQLIDYIDAARGIYREIKHMQRLRARGLNVVFCQANQDRVSWFNFLLAWLINLLLITTYTSASGPLEVGFHVAPAISGLQYLQCIISFFVLVSSLVIRSPVVYEALEEDGHTGYYLYAYTAMDQQTMYLVWFFLFSLLAAFQNFYFSAFLLLDLLSKNATTRAVLNAVVTPRRQLGWAVILGLITIYAYSFYIVSNSLLLRDYWIDGYLYVVFVLQFAHYSYSFDENLENACHTLWGCFKMSLYCIQSGGGVSDYMNDQFDTRLVLTVTFYLVFMTILLNVIFGIIIDTFGGLRQEKDERFAQTVNYCFVCGIDKQTFDRMAVDSSDGFRRHIRVDHNMWNYLKFVIFIWEQDRDDDDGLEQFVRRCVDSADVSWMPLSKAIKLDQAESEEQRLHRETKLVINNSQVSLQTKIDSFQTELYGHLVTVTESLMKAAAAAQPDTLGKSVSLDSGRRSPQTLPQASQEGGNDDDDVSVGHSIAMSESAV
jgi:hypothetical protein